MATPPASTDIAIIGMAGLFPGAKDIHAYWNNIINKVDNINDAPDDWAVPYYDPDCNPKKEPMFIYTRKVGLLGELSEFNPVEYGVLPSSIDGGEPDHFIALKMAGEALKDAGYWQRDFNREKTGVILGRGSYPNRGLVSGIQCGIGYKQTIDLIRQLFPHLEDETVDLITDELIRCLPEHEVEKAQSLISNVATGRIANRLNLMGPNYMIDAACSSCHLAVDQAMRDLWDGRADMVLAGAVQASMPPLVYQLFCQLDALSRRHIRPFDQSADGTLLGEGAGFLVLKRLEDAERDGDRIYAVVKSVGISSDGKGLGMLAPRFEGQILAIKRAYEQAGIDPATIDLVEAHGTGIPLGDQTEIKSLTEVFGKRQGRLPRCGIGSVKSMIGHCIPASGAASLIKMALALHYKTLPPTLCDEVNPKLGIDGTPFYVNNETRPWIHRTDSPRRAAIDAFGFGGINAHAILEEYPSGRETKLWTLGRLDDPTSVDRPVDPVWKDWPSELVVLAEADRSKLVIRIQKVRQLLEAEPELNLADLAYSLYKTNPTDSAPCRLALIVNNLADLIKKLDQAIEKLADTKRTKWQTRSGMYYGEGQTPPGKIAFLFSGEGAQHPNMMLDLCLHFPQAAAWFNFLDETFSFREAPTSRFIYPPPTGLPKADKDWVTERIFAGDLATEALFGSSMSLYELLCDFGIRSDVMAGHSSGEHIAMAAGGISDYPSRDVCMEHLRRLNQLHFDLEDLDAVPKGTVISVGGIDITELQQHLNATGGAAYLVADNCPKQQTIFARAEATDTVIQQLQAAGGLCMRLPFDRGVHTPLYEPALPKIREAYGQLPVKASIVPVYSCANVSPYPREADSPEEILAIKKAGMDLSVQQWTLPVRFRETVEQLYEDGARVFIEVGASSSLIAFVNSTLQGKEDYLALATSNPRKSGLEQLQTLMGRLFVQGVPVRLNSFYKHRPMEAISLEVGDYVNRRQPMSYPIKLLLPRFSLKPEFVESIKDKLYPPEITGSGHQEAVSQNSQETGKTYSSAVSPPSSGAASDQLPASSGVEHQRQKHSSNHYESLQAAPDARFPQATLPLEETASPSPETTNGQPMANGFVASETSSPGQPVHDPAGGAEHPQATILAKHYELMQEFLANQARVTQAFFTQQAQQHPNSDD